MKAAYLHEARDIRIGEAPDTPPGPGELLLSVAVVRICGSDLHSYLHGQIGDIAPESPLILGHEAAGIIAAIGPANEIPFRIGQLVAIDPCVPCGRCEYCERGKPPARPPSGANSRLIRVSITSANNGLSPRNTHGADKHCPEPSPCTRPGSADVPRLDSCKLPNDPIGGFDEAFGSCVNIRRFLENLQRFAEEPLRGNLAAVARQPRLGHVAGGGIDLVGLRLRSMVLPQFNPGVRLAAPFRQKTQRRAIAFHRQHGAGRKINRYTNDVICFDTAQFQNGGAPIPFRSLFQWYMAWFCSLDRARLNLPSNFYPQNNPSTETISR